MPRNPIPDSARARFADLLAVLLLRGQRPNAAEGEAWSDEGFAGKVTSSREKKDGPVSPRSVSNWRKGTALPAELEPILRALFGPTTNLHAEARRDLREAFRAAQAEKRAEVIARAKPDPAGARWIVQGGVLAMDRTSRASDRRAATDGLQQQLHEAVRDMAKQLADATSRPSNSPLVGLLSANASAFGRLLECDPLQMPERLVDAHRLSLFLGEILDMDDTIRGEGSEPSLDPVIRGQLSVLVRMAAPWLRGFPTIADLDDRAGATLAQTDLLDPALQFIRIAGQHNIIPADDEANVVVALSAAHAEEYRAQKPGYQGRKAGALAIGDARNLLLAAATLVAAREAGLAVANEAGAELVRRVAATLVAAEVPIKAFATVMPADLRHALEGVVAGARHPMAPPTIAVRSDSGMSWAEASGSDKFGRWARFSVPAADGSRVTQRLRWCPPGKFMMGSPVDEDGRFDSEGPLHEVVFARGFWLFETACRQELWQAVTGKNQSEFKGLALPVEMVSFEDVQGFLARLNARVPGLDLALPSEAQWEYGCRADTATAYSFGPEISRQQVNYAPSKGTVRVGSLPANRWGLYEMHGNLWEWCADTWHGSYVGAPTDGSAWVDGGAANRVVRGGSWYHDARGVRAAYRFGFEPGSRFDYLGFRCARVQ